MGQARYAYLHGLEVVDGSEDQGDQGQGSVRHARQRTGDGALRP